MVLERTHLVIYIFLLNFAVHMSNFGATSRFHTIAGYK